jgi:hypothetical protein
MKNNEHRVAASRQVHAQLFLEDRTTPVHCRRQASSEMQKVNQPVLAS